MTVRHEPRSLYDCTRCLLTCRDPEPTCALTHLAYQDPPIERMREVDAALIAAGHRPVFRLRTLRRLQDPA
jgi:hypothetical protein